ncbi:hypothetical protein CPB85DRAFT_795554 [Mucidula mucida]|nr:hypothetical protein CPB85DRAFT_795554 [Mucidula mucida]
MSRHNGLLSSSSASRIPAEVWAEIFTFALPYPLAVSSFERALCRPSEVPWNVSHVCSFWRRTTLCCSCLWSHDTIHIGNDCLALKDPVSLVKARLERARYRGCNFTWALSAYRGRNGALAQELFQVLIHYSTCWESVTLRVLILSVDRINSLRGALPMLRSLHLTHYAGSKFTAFEACPLLERLVLAGSAGSETQSSFPWGQLREFIDRRSRSFSDEDAIATYYQNILTSSLNLEQLQVTNIMIPALREPVAHQKLSYLCICNAEFLCGLSLPALQQLMIDSTFYDSTPQPEDINTILLALFTSSDGCPHLEYLLVTDAFPDVDLIHVFQAIPTLKRLSMRYEHLDEATVELLPLIILALSTFDDTDPWLELVLDAPDYNSIKFHLLPVLESFKIQFKWHPDVPNIDSLVSGIGLVQMLCKRYVLPEHPSLQDACFIFASKEIGQPREQVLGLYQKLKKHGLNVNIELHTRQLQTDVMDMLSLLADEEED